MGWNNPPIPWREFERRLSWHTGEPGGPPEPGPREVPELPAELPPEPPAEPARPAQPWVELHCHSSSASSTGLGIRRSWSRRRHGSG